MDFKKLSPLMIAGGAALLLIVVFIAMIWGSYNNFVRLDQGVSESWANVETQYQRRFDLIPNLVEVTQKYATFEKDTLTEITQLRSQWQTGTPQQLADSDNQFQSALSRLLLITENYPNLKADSQFIALQDGLTETENMVSVSRLRYNGAVREYNTAIRLFPGTMFAGMFGFSQKSYFESTSGSENAPRVNLTI